MKNFGFINRIIEEVDYLFGNTNITRTVLQPNGQWFDYLPEYECQNIKFETTGCSLFSATNCVEILLKRQFGISENYSERYLYNLIPIRPPGGDPHIVAESIRKFGLIKQEILPMVDTFEEYITPTPMTQEFINLGKNWLKSHWFKHEYLWKNEPNLKKRNKILKNALQYSPVIVSVTAWIAENDVYRDYGQPNNHLCVCIGYEDDNFIVFDSYDHSIKKLDILHHIEVAKAYYIGVL